MVSTTDLVSYYKLDETSGTTSEDAHGSNDLDEVGSASSPGADGIIGKAWNFNNTVGAYLESTNNSGISGNDARTISCWVYKHDSTDNVFVGLGTASNNQEFAVATAHDGDGVHEYLSIVGYFNDNTEATPSLTSTETWYHIVVTFNGTTLKAYVNNEEVIDVSETYNTSSNTIKIGTRSSWGGATNARIDEVGIWSRALNSTEVSDLYNSGNGLAYPFTTGETIFPQVQMSGDGLNWQINTI